MRYLHCAFGYLLLVAGARARHSKLFTSQPAFADYPFPTISIECTELGPSGTYLDKDHTSEGAGLIPALSWPSPADDTVEYLLISEDPDAPIPESVTHGIYYRIPRDKTGVQHPDFRIKKKSWEPYMLRGGFKYGKNRQDSVYVPPSAFFGQGPHRYFFELVALNDSIETDNMSVLATRGEVHREIIGKVAGWGEWVGVFESP
ncbi:phosphatidylethanolamine-binding protein [Aspergillus cavernicola]|uniref:Phosphatidylethanolamine-binding protein n=1 Tax=Aspergillus cavernicola TaxID=176166 RepID=A0ABR4HP58_9EURO